MNKNTSPNDIDNLNRLFSQYNKHSESCEKKAKEIQSWGTKKQPDLTFLKKRP